MQQKFKKNIQNLPKREMIKYNTINTYLKHIFKEKLVHVSLALIEMNYPTSKHL